MSARFAPGKVFHGRFALLFRSFKGFTYLIIESPTIGCPIWLDWFILSEFIALNFVFDEASI